MDVGQILSTFPPIVENIFKFLNWYDLDSCSSVCDFWHRIAETEKNRRKNLFWFIQGIDRLSQNEAQDMESELTKKLNNLKVHPCLCLAFATPKFIKEFENLFPNMDNLSEPQRKRVRTEGGYGRRGSLNAAIHSVMKYLPDQCETTFCVAPGVIGSKEDCEPLEFEKGYAISGIMLPYVPGLEVYSFPLHKNRYKISELLPASARIKCLLVFAAKNFLDRHSYDPKDCNIKLLQSCLARERNKVAVGGSVVNRVVSFSGKVIAFCGDSVDAASVMIRPFDTEANLENRLKSFQDTGLLQGRCFALMFSSTCRNYMLENVESSVFHKLYPNIPLLGVFGEGEVGVNYLPNNTSQCDPQIPHGKEFKCRKMLLHNFYSVFVLISLKS